MDDIDDVGSPTNPDRHGATQREVPRHTLTIKQAKQLFISFGVPRSTRSIQRFCEIGTIDCIRVKGEKVERYFIDQPSVERYALELKQLERISHIEEDVPRRDASQRDGARYVATPDGDPVSTTMPDRNATLFSARVDILEKENFQLQIDRAAKEQVIGQMLEERRAWLGQLNDQSREIGRLEMQIQQIAAPRHDTARHVATDLVRRVDMTFEEETMIDAEHHSSPSTPPATPDLPKPSVWRRIFG